MQKDFKSKFIIYNYTDIPDSELLQYILGVVLQGKCSKTSKGKQYCFLTKFKPDVIVVSDMNHNGTDIFRLYREDKE